MLTKTGGYEKSEDGESPLFDRLLKYCSDPDHMIYSRMFHRPLIGWIHYHMPILLYHMSTSFVPIGCAWQCMAVRGSVLMRLSLMWLSCMRLEANRADLELSGFDLEGSVQFFGDGLCFDGLCMMAVFDVTHLG